MKNLNVFALAANDHLVQPEEFEDINNATSALAILTDFRNHKPHMVDSHLEASEALEVMLAEDVKIKLVIDGGKEFVGVVSVDDLSEHNLLLKQMALHVQRDELLVRDLMQPRSSIRAIDVSELAKVSVGDVVATLKKNHQEYLVVVDQAAHHIRGIISARDISCRLRSPIHIEKERTFVDIFSAVRVN